jgi:hypothetical protein
MNALAKSHHLDIGIGGVHVRLRTDSTDFIALMADRFRGFTGHVAARTTCSTSTSCRSPTPRTSRWTASPPKSRVLRDGPKWRLLCGDFDAEWDPRTRHGHVRLHPSPYSLDSVLRILHTVMLAEQGGMLMHASSVVLDGRAYCSPACPESGKTTISRLAPPTTRTC